MVADNGPSADIGRPDPTAAELVPPAHDEARADLIWAFHSLSSDDQHLRLLVGSIDFASCELAELLGCSEQAARLRLHRARKRLDRQVRRP